MIYGYIIVTKSGLLVRYRFFGRFTSVDDEKISLLATGITALLDFFTTVSGAPLETALGGNYKMSIVSRGDIVFAVLTDRNDAMGEVLANKYSIMFTKRLSEQNIDLSVVMEELLNKILNDLFEALDREIEELNEKSKSFRYIS